MKKLVFAALIAALVVPAMAAPIFFDDFNSENGGKEELNYTGFANWKVTDGTVDLIGNGGKFDFLPGNGLYVDMDGSTGQAGRMISSNAIQLTAGTYELSYMLAGNQRNTANETVHVNVYAGVSAASHSLSKMDPFTVFKQRFTLDSDQSITISFQGVGGDNIGMLLDNVKLSAVPAPGAILLTGIGTSLVGWLRRRRSL